MEIYIGTSGYSFPDWKNVFYPKRLKPQNYFAYYVKHFNAVEINLTFYRIPRTDFLATLSEKTGSDFQFAVKLPRILTHELELHPASIEGMITLTKPILKENKLAALLAQFPFAFHRTDANLAHLFTIRDAFKNFPFFVEFRHKSWNNEETLDKLEKENIGIVFPDIPHGLGLFELRNVISHNRTAYFRLHSRRKESWWVGDNKSRYDYSYSQEEFLEIKKLVEGAKAGKTLIFFNNCPQGKAAKNAISMRQIMGLENSEIRSMLFE